MLSRKLPLLRTACAQNAKNEPCPHAHCSPTPFAGCEAIPATPTTRLPHPASFRTNSTPLAGQERRFVEVFQAGLTGSDSSVIIDLRSIVTDVLRRGCLKRFWTVLLTVQIDP
jgi:hypothetical protein